MKTARKWPSKPGRSSDSFGAALTISPARTDPWLQSLTAPTLWATSSSPTARNTSSSVVPDAS